MAKDPVCGMMVDEKRAAATAVSQGATYYFCALMCTRAFEQTPERFIGKK
ncbi:MAG: YHS domain-containing protein [Candidatus Methylomirabilis sp.]